MHNAIFRKIIFPMMEQYYGTEIQTKLNWLNKTQWYSRKEIEELQEKKLRALINHAYRNVPYYHNLFKKENIYPENIKNKEDLKKIPILTKDLIRKNLLDLLARNIKQKNIIESYSSGSTGEPMKYYIDKRAETSRWAQTFRCWNWAGYNLGDNYVKISLNPRKKLVKRFQDLLLNTNYIYAFGITETNINQELRRIEKFRPKIIRGYASYMFGIAKMMERLDIEFSGASIATTGSMLYPNYRNVIEKQFNCRVFDGYGGEGTAVSFECENHDCYHLCDEDVIVEFIKESGITAPNEIGRIVFTNLENYAMPFIRYDIKDLGTFSDEVCSCGRGLSLMKSIAGRDSDIVVTSKGDIIVVEFFVILFEYIKGVNQFQVIQEKKDKLVIKIVKNDLFTNDDFLLINNEIQKKMGNDSEIDIEFVDEIPLSGRSGKRRIVISKIPINL